MPPLNLSQIEHGDQPDDATDDMHNKWLATLGGS